MEGEKMSKSLGNIIPLREAISRYGADPLRISLLATASLLQDADFSIALAKSMSEHLERLYNHAVKVVGLGEPAGEEGSVTWLDRWLLSRIQRHIQTATEAMECLEVMRACQTALYLLDRDVQWYLRRTRDELEAEDRRRAAASVLREALKVQIKLLAPFIPHLAEEVWSLLRGKGFVGLAPWPSSSGEKIDLRAEEMENLVLSVMEDTKNILKATSLAPKRICYYTASEWKSKAYLKVAEATVKGEASLPRLIKESIGLTGGRGEADRVAKFVKKNFEAVSRMAKDRLERIVAVGLLDETACLRAALQFLEGEFHAKVEVYGEEDPGKYDPKGRSSLAEPYRPGIYVE